MEESFTEASWSLALGIGHEVYLVDLIAEHYLYTLQFAEEKHHGLACLLCFEFRCAFSAQTAKDTENQHEEIGEEVAEGAEEILQFLMVVGLETLLAKTVGKLGVSVKGIHVHTNGCEFHSAGHAYALSNSPFSFIAVL